MSQALHEELAQWPLDGGGTTRMGILKAIGIVQNHKPAPAPDVGDEAESLLAAYDFAKAEGDKLEAIQPNVDILREAIAAMGEPEQSGIESVAAPSIAVADAVQKKAASPASDVNPLRGDDWGGGTYRAPLDERQGEIPYLGNERFVELPKSLMDAAENIAKSVPVSVVYETPKSEPNLKGSNVHD
jgi:hypothetical protein